MKILSNNKYNELQLEICKLKNDNNYYIQDRNTYDFMIKRCNKQEKNIQKLWEKLEYYKNKIMKENYTMTLVEIEDLIKIIESCY